MTRKCPSDGALIALFMNEAALPKKEKLLRHLASCKRCALRFDVLRQAKRDLQPHVDSFADAFGADEGVSLLRSVARRKILALDPGPPRSPSRHGPFGMLLGLRFATGLIALLVVAMAGGLILLTRLERHSQLRSPSVKLTLLAPVGTLSAPPRIFRWTPVLNAENYVIDLIDETLRPVHRFGAYIINEVELPPDVRSKLNKGRTYVWSVSARDGDDNILTSRSASFVIE